MGNLIGSFFQVYPTFGSLMRSAVADSYGAYTTRSQTPVLTPHIGAKTQFYQIVVSTIVLMAILFFGPLFFYLPKVVLASIIIVAATGLVELEDIVFLWKVRAFKSLALLAVTFFLTILFGVEEVTRPHPGKTDPVLTREY